jgi:hypothetical protein
MTGTFEMLGKRSPIHPNIQLRTLDHHALERLSLPRLIKRGQLPAKRIPRHVSQQIIEGMGTVRIKRPCLEDIGKPDISANDSNGPGIQLLS